jgi:hypothetical protein
MRKQHTARARCSNTKAAVPPPPPAATRVRSSGESSAVWLDDEDVTLLEDGTELGVAAATEKRHDDTLRIWCPRA